MVTVQNGSKLLRVSRRFLLASVVGRGSNIALSLKELACARVSRSNTLPLKRLSAMNTYFFRYMNILSLTVVTLALSLSVKAASVEAELSRVTLFVEGMMKSRGGVT